MRRKASRHCAVIRRKKCGRRPVPAWRCCAPSCASAEEGAMGQLEFLLVRRLRRAGAAGRRRRHWWWAKLSTSAPRKQNAPRPSRREKNLSPASGLSRPEFLGALRAARNRVNSGSYWLFSPDAKAASHAARRILKAAPRNQAAAGQRRLPGLGLGLWRLRRRQPDAGGGGEGAESAGRRVARHRGRRCAAATNFRASRKSMMPPRCS